MTKVTLLMSSVDHNSIILYQSSLPPVDSIPYMDIRNGVHRGSEVWRQSELGRGLYNLVVMIITYRTLHSSPPKKEATSSTGVM